MIKKVELITVNQSEKLQLVSWSDKLTVDIEIIDMQHKELVNLTNELYRACLITDPTLTAVFKETMSRLVDYVRFHFTTEIEIMERINFPNTQSHKMQHDQLIMQILKAVHDYNRGKKFIPNQFVRTLKDWIFSHVAIYDQEYATFVRTQKNRGLLTDKDIYGQEAEL